MESKLRDARKEKKMTQSELSQASGISRATICAIESGKELNVSVKTMKAIASALDTTPAVIFF